MQTTRQIENKKIVPDLKIFFLWELKITSILAAADYSLLTKNLP